MIGVEQSAVTQAAERIACEVMAEKLGLEMVSVSANSFGAVLIREGIERYAASMPATQTDQDKLISDLVAALEHFERLKRSIMIDVGSCHSLRGPGASSEMRSDDRDMREDMEAAWATAEGVLTRARQIGGAA